MNRARTVAQPSSALGAAVVLLGCHGADGASRAFRARQASDFAKPAAH